MTPDAPPSRTPTLADFPARGPNSLASFGERAAAWICDLLVVLAPTVVVWAVVAAVVDIPVDAEPEQISEALPFWLPAVPVLLWVLYVIPAVAWRGQTLGQLVLGHRVARFTDGRTPSLDQAAIRALLPAALALAPMLVVRGNPFIVFPGWSVCYLTAASAPMMRGLHDRAAGTVVVRSR